MPQNAHSFLYYLLHFTLTFSQQRNVGILEKIVGSLTNASIANKAELRLQYQAQADVIGQLGDKVQRLVREQKQSSGISGTSKTVLIKLERAFARVQSRALALQQAVSRQQQQQQSAAAAAAASSQQQSDSNVMEEYQRQQQLQMQQDVRDDA